MPKFSIIIPVYNVAPYLRECLDSVLKQTCLDWEAICVDDGSTDDSGAILDEYAAHDTRFRIIHQHNAGVSAARNAALDAALGEWIGFVDADDMIDEDWLQVAEEIIRKERPDLVRLKLRQALSRASDKNFQYSIYEGGELLEWGAKTFFKGGFPCLNFLLRERLGDSRYLVGMRLCEDTFFMLNVVKKCSKAVQCEYDGYYYRVRPGSASGSVYFIKDLAKVLDEYEKAIITMPPSAIDAGSAFLATNLEWWYSQRNCGERYAVAINKFHRLFSLGLLRLRNMPGGSALGLRGIIYFKSLWGMKIVSALRKIRKYL